MSTLSLAGAARRPPARGALRRGVISTLLYYDIWRYPLTGPELHAFHPRSAPSRERFIEDLKTLAREGVLRAERGFYWLPGSGSLADERLRRQRHARRMWFMARIAARVIKSFPFVRAVFVSGDLSKDATGAGSDVDFFILTQPRRLWIARTLLVLFKKTVLLNRKKFFCVNSFASTDALEVAERNIYQATEIAQLKPLYNTDLFRAYLAANRWIREYFPNFDTGALRLPRATERRSALQRLAELPFRALPADRIDRALMRAMRREWARRHPELDERTRREIFLCAPGESRAYAGNFQGKVLHAYQARLRAYGVTL